MNSNELLLDTCSQLVSSLSTFKNSYTNYQPYPYKNYHDKYGRWHIASSSEPPVYWQWFIRNYYSDIIKWVGASGTYIPWQYVTENTAVSSLHDIIS